MTTKIEGEGLLSVDLSAEGLDIDDERDDDAPAWRAFLASAEGQRLTPERRAAVEAFGWAKPPTSADLEALAELLRANEERAQGDSAAVIEGAEALAFLARRTGRRVHLAALDVLRCAVHYLPEARERLFAYGAIGLAADYRELFEHGNDPRLAERAHGILAELDDIDTMPLAEWREAFDIAIGRVDAPADWRAFVRLVVAGCVALGRPDLDELVIEELDGHNPEIAAWRREREAAGRE